MSGETFHVDDDAPGGDGLSWSNAMKSLQAALEQASLTPEADEIRVAKGTYVPTFRTNPSDARSATFFVNFDEAQIIGGYAGYNLSAPDSRNPRRNHTILSGDLAGDDGPGFSNNSENAYHVMRFEGVDDSVVLRGFQVVGGNADVNPDESGGGILIDDASPRIASRC